MMGKHLQTEVLNHEYMAVGKLEEGLAVLGALEDERRGHEDRRLDRPLRELGIVAVAHHQRLGAQPMPIDLRRSIPLFGVRHGLLVETDHGQPAPSPGR
mgnify:CR=1 FL=1